MRIGRYQIHEKIGEGGMGVVWAASDPTLHRKVAIKQLTNINEDALARFYNEARAAGQLQHENIVTVYEVVPDPAQPFIVMEHVAGSSLRCLMDSEDPQETLDLTQKFELLRDILLGLGHAHSRRIYHRDIKPENIMLNEQSRGKLLDFGIAKLAEINMTRTKVVLGTLPYMSPEQVKGQEVDGRSDLFSLGVVLYELICGDRPFDSDDIYSTMQRIACEPAPELEPLGAPCPELLKAIVERALTKNRQRRYATAELMLEDVESYLEVLADPDSAEASLPPASPREIFEKASRAYFDGEYWSAVQGFERVLELVPDNPSAASNLAKAEAAWQHTHLEELERIGLLLWKKKDYLVAVKTFEKQLALDPGSELAKWLITLCRRRLREHDETTPFINLLRDRATEPGVREALDAGVDSEWLVRSDQPPLSGMDEGIARARTHTTSDNPVFEDSDVKLPKDPL